MVVRDSGLPGYASTWSKRCGVNRHHGDSLASVPWVSGSRR